MRRSAPRAAAAAFLLAAFCACAANDAPSVSPELFLEKLRSPRGRETWALMIGQAEHRRKGAEPVTATVRAAIRFAPKRTLAQLVVDGKEGYIAGQTYKGGPDSGSIVPMDGPMKDSKNTILGNLGLRPQDLTMSFLYWDLVKELPAQSVKSLDCRALLLQSPDKKENVRVYASSDYLFPLRAEWLDPSGPEDQKPKRTLEAVSFREEDNKFWVLTGLSIFGPGWKTSVSFDDSRAGYSDKEPKDLFLSSLKP